jgi:hypothetical protein
MLGSKFDKVPTRLDCSDLALSPLFAYDPSCQNEVRGERSELTNER